MSKGEFFRQSLRITVMQILRGIGFDRAPPHLIDILTDVYIRHLLLLASEAQSLSQLSGRGDHEVLIQDVTQSLINCGMLKPSNLLDVYELDYAEDQSAKPFLNWVVGHVTENQRMVSKPTRLNTGKPKIVESNVGNGINSGGNSLLMNSSMHATSGNNTLEASVSSLPSSLRLDGGDTREGDGEESTDEDWLSFYMKHGGVGAGGNTTSNGGKTNKLASNYDKMFDVTELRPLSVTKSDVTVMGPTPINLLDKLPSSIRKQQNLLILEDEQNIGDNRDYNASRQQFIDGTPAGFSSSSSYY